MQKNTLLGITCFLVFVACKKDNREQEFDKCIRQNTIPQTHYDVSVIVPSQNDSAHCGYLPLNKKNYWIYLDSTFDYTTGQFLNEIVDTLRFRQTFITPDSIVWWKPDVSNQPDYYFFYKGFYTRMYSTDSSLYTFNEGIFNTKRAIKWCNVINADSVSEWSIWNDVGQVETIAKKLILPVAVPAGTFTGCTKFSKIWGGGGPGEYRFYIVYKPELGILKSIITTGPNQIIYRTSTLLQYHIE